MAERVASFLAAVDEFSSVLEERGDQCPRTRLAIEDLRAALADEFDADRSDNLRGRRKRSEGEARLARQLQYQVKQRKLAEEELAAASGKSSGLLRVELVTKVGLSDPSLNTRQVRGVLRQQGCPVSHAHIGKIRGAFAEVLKDAVRGKVRAEVAKVAATGPVPPVFLLHIHDAPGFPRSRTTR